MEKERNVASVTTRIPTSTWKWLTSIDTAGGAVKAIIFEAERAAKAGIPPHKISENLLNLQVIRRKTMNELKGTFTQAEWSLMADSLNGSLLPTDFRCVASALIANVEDSDSYDGLGSKWNVDIKALCEKIGKLTAAQVDAVFTRIEEFWDDENKDLKKWAEW